MPSATLASKSKGPKDLVAALRAEAKANQTFNDVMKLFASRERSRNRINITNLSLTMSREGYKHTREAYRDVLETMARLGIGQLEKTQAGAIRGLKGITVTLQSLGYAALGKEAYITPAKTYMKYEPVLPDDAPVGERIVVRKHPENEGSVSSAMAAVADPAGGAGKHGMKLLIDYDGETVSIDLPRRTSKEISVLISYLLRKDL